MKLAQPILFYDGVCHLCNGLVQFILTNENNNDLMFSSLQSDYARRTLPSHLIDDLNTVVFFEPNSDRFLTKTAAVSATFKIMGGIWYLNGLILSFFPLFVSNFVYDFIAANRYNWFGESEVCIRLNVDDRVLED